MLHEFAYKKMLHEFDQAKGPNPNSRIIAAISHSVGTAWLSPFPFDYL
jgi:hypothetical protein